MSDAEIEFVNRTEELETLRDRLSRASPTALIVLRSPSGYGKSRLTDRLVQSLTGDGPSCVVIDPAIRSKSRSGRIYPWFFVQRAAEPGSIRAVAGRDEFRTFSDYLRRSKVTRINWKHAYENLKEAASISKLVRLVVEFVENLVKRGKYDPDTLLKDDGHFATDLAKEYVRALAAHRQTVFVVREAQSIDLESLRFFVALGDELPGTKVVLEYTTSEGRFESDHEKALFDGDLAEDRLVVFDLVKLNLREFRSLLKKYAPVDTSVEATAEVWWDGNLRIIRELKYRLMLGHSLSGSPGLMLGQALQRNLDLLTRREQLLLALIAANVEGIQIDVLTAVIADLGLTGDSSSTDVDLVSLSERFGYVRVESGLASLADEDLADGVKNATRLKGLLRLAESGLREFYLDVVKGQRFATISLQLALRQAMALCSSTGDVIALRGLIAHLDGNLKVTHDQTLYVNIVAEAVLRHPDLSRLEVVDLVDWAATAAYDVADYPMVVSLIERVKEPRPDQQILLACCYGEVNRHTEALSLARQVASRFSANKNLVVASSLIEVAAQYSLGNKDIAASLHAQLRTSDLARRSDLFGFVLRFTEIIDDFPKCTDDMLESVRALRRQGFQKAAAYSSLAAAMHLAYGGRLTASRRQLAQAETQLSAQVIDRQILANNSVVLELLSDSPNLTWCLEQLHAAMFGVRDDFSRLVLNNNRLICYWLLGDHARADLAVAAIDRIIAAPNFGNRDVFWTVCFNVWSYLAEIGRHEDSQRFRAIPLELAPDFGSYHDYWQVRYGFSEEVPAEFSFVMKFKYHPEYLSHWVIDAEGLESLKAIRVQ